MPRLSPTDAVCGSGMASASKAGHIIVKFQNVKYKMVMKQAQHKGCTVATADSGGQAKGEGLELELD